MRTKVLETVRKYRMILPGEMLVLGVSGGPDSMALLYIMYDLRDDLQCMLHIAHLNHKLREKESEVDVEYVMEHARKLGLPIMIETVDVRKMIMPGESLESAARRIRYEFYERVMSCVRADKVALGHTADDQAETVMMRLLRGSGTQGLSGIPPVRDDKFIRPLIEVSRSEIERYLQNLGLIPRLDSSNLSMEHERNRIRLELIPFLESKYSPNIKHILQQTGDVLRTEDEFLTDLAQEVMNKCVEHHDARTIAICISTLREQHLALQRRILRLAIKTLIGDLNGFDFDHIRDLLDIAIYGATGNVISLPRGISAEKSYDRLVLRSGYQPKISTKPFDYPVEVPGETQIPELGLVIKMTVEGIGQRAKDKKSYAPRPTPFAFSETFDYGKIRGDLHLRNRRPGDRFQPLGMSGTKKLKDFFIDEKAPRSIRDSVPILTCRNDILWIVGYRIDDRFKITADTKTQLNVTVSFQKSAD